MGFNHDPFGSAIFTMSAEEQIGAARNGRGPVGTIWGKSERMRQMRVMQLEARIEEDRRAISELEDRLSDHWCLTDSELGLLQDLREQVAYDVEELEVLSAR